MLSLCFHHFFLCISMILNLNCFYNIFAKKRSSHGHFKYIKMHQLIHGLMLIVAIMLLSPPKYFISIEIEISAIVLFHVKPKNLSGCPKPGPRWFVPFDYKTQQIL